MRPFKETLGGHANSSGTHDEFILQMKYEVLQRMFTGKRFPILIGLASKHCYDLQVDPKDIIQESILSLLKNDVNYLLEIESRGIIAISSILKNKAIDLYRKEKIRKQYHKLQYAHFKRLEENDGEMQDTENQELQFIDKAISKLKPKNRAVMELARIGYKNSEIAEVLCLNPKTISSIKNRCREAIKKSMAFGYGGSS